VRDRREVRRHGFLCLQPNLVFSLDGCAERILEHWSARTQRNQRVVLRPHLPWQELVLTILGRAEVKRLRQHVRRLLAQHLPRQPEEVVRLPKVRNPRPLPVPEQDVGVPVDDRRIALEHEHAAPAPAESQCCREASQPATEHNDVRAIPLHTPEIISG
jgi:hypothetical protein